MPLDTLPQREQPIDRGIAQLRPTDKLMAPEELRAIIQRELWNADGADSSELSAERTKAMEYYNGEEFASPPPGQNRSRVVMLTVLETVEWVLPALLRIFTASETIANIEPTREENTEAAQQASDYVSHIFFKDNAGFLVLHDWFKDALLLKVGWVKRWWETTKTRESTSYTGLTQEQYQAILNPPPTIDGNGRTLPDQPEIEVLEERSYPGPMPAQVTEDAPNPGAPTLYDCTIRVTKKQGRIVIDNVPPEEVLFSRRAKRGSIPFVAHRSSKTRTELLLAGYDEDCLDRLPWNDVEDYNQEKLERHARDQSMPLTDDRTDLAMRRYWVDENYIWVDYDGDGLAELCKVVTGNRGGEILTKGGEYDIEELDDMPLVPICPVPIPHKLVGMSVADLVMDLQRIKSTLIRQMLDNIYLTNTPRHALAENAITDETLDDLLYSTPGGVVRLKDIAGIQPLVTPFVAEKALDLVTYFDQVGEQRTGVARHNQGLDPDDLNKTATGVNLIQQAAAQRVELIARIFAYGVQSLVEGILGLVKRHQQQERIIRVTGNFLKLDPRQWKHDLETTVSVGLGTGNRDQVAQHLMQILQIQQGIVQVQQGVSGPLVYAKNVYDVTSRITEAAGFKESFFTDPSQPPPGAAPPPGPQSDPQAMAAQQMAQAEQQVMVVKAQLDMRLNQQKAEQQAQLDNQKAAHDRDLDAQRMQNDYALQQQKLQHDFIIGQQRATNDKEIALLKAQHQHETAMQAAAMQPAPQPAGAL